MVISHRSDGGYIVQFRWGLYIIFPTGVILYSFYGGYITYIVQFCQGYIVNADVYRTILTGVLTGWGCGRRGIYHTVPTGQFGGKMRRTVLTGDKPYVFYEGIVAQF